MNFGLTSLLPQLFFRKDGRWNKAWWVTVFPFMISPLGVLGAMFFPAHAVFGAWCRLTSVHRGCAGMVALASYGLLMMTLGTHRIPLALWHQRDAHDAPVHLVTWGPYRFVRHPFYASYLLSFIAAVLYAPTFLTVSAWLYATIAVSLTARGEERRLCASPLGDEYREYMQTTGRFFPRFSLNVQK